jgi:hypothetical protein
LSIDTDGDKRECDGKESEGVHGGTDGVGGMTEGGELERGGGR